MDSFQNLHLFIRELLTCHMHLPRFLLISPPLPVFHLFVMISLSTLWDFHLFICPHFGISIFSSVHKHTVYGFVQKMSTNVPKCPEMSSYVLKCPPHVQGLTCYHVSCENLLRHQQQNGSCFSTALAVARHDDACKVHMKKCVVLCRVNVVQCRPDVVLMS